MRLLTFLLTIPAGAALAQDVKPQDIKPEIHPINGGWERLQTGGAEATAGLQVSSQVRVVLRGGAANNRISFRLVQRVKDQESVGRLTGSASISSGPEVTVISAQGKPAYSTLELYVPATVRTAKLEAVPGGDIEVYDFRGNLQAHTPYGDIQADNIGGSVFAQTGGGHIRFGKVAGKVECSSGAGSITVASAAAVHCQTVGGEIVVTESRGMVWLSSGGGNVQVDRAAQSVEVHSMKGAIQVGQAGGLVTADTHGGAIRIGSAAGVRAESAAGPVRVMGANGPLSVSTAFGSILAELIAGARIQDSSLVTASGDITVMIPSNVALSVMATNEMGGVPRIDSDFSGIRLSSLNFGRPPLAEGMINGGGPVLLLSGSGMIYLRRVK